MGLPLSEGVVSEAVEQEGATVVCLKGDVDLHRAPELHERLVKITNGRPDRVVVDLTDVRYIDSSGVATLISAFQRVNQHGGTLFLAGLQPRVRSVFEIAQLERILPMYASRQEALEA